MNKEEIYKAMDSFLVETDKPRSIERLNLDRHLFVKRVLGLFKDQAREVIKAMLVEEREIPYEIKSMADVDVHRKEAEVYDRDIGFNQCCALQKEKGQKIRSNLEKPIK